MWNSLKNCIDNETKTDCGEFGLEVCSLNASSDSLDLTSAILPNASDLLSADAKTSELSFTRFLSSDFVKQPFILASRERNVSDIDESQKQSTPTNPHALKNAVGSVSPLQSESTQKQNQNEVWGSPLKVNIPADYSLIESLDNSGRSLASRKRKPRRLGIPLKQAKKLISTFNINSEVTSTVSTLLVLCDGGDGKKTALSGVKMFPVPRENRTAKGLKVMTVTVDKKGSVEEWNSKLKMGEGQSHSNQAIFEIQGETWGTIIVEFKWKGARRLLELPPSDANTTIKASVHPGCEQSRVNVFYQELQFLHRIVDALTTDEMVWFSSTSDQAAVPLTTAVKSLLENLQDAGSLKSALAADEGEKVAEWSLATAMQDFNVQERKDLDFTDVLWKELTKCMSLADLIASLRLVFTALSRGHLRPFVDSHNQTTLARLVRGALSGRIFMPVLTGEEPLVLLAEIGAEKLSKDYISIFVSRGLATPSALEFLTDPEKELVPKLQDLNKLHSMVEMITLLGTYVRLTPDTLSAVACQMLTHYKHHPYTPYEVFTFPVKSSEVRMVLSSAQPEIWCMESTNEVGEALLYCLCAKQPFVHLLDGKEDNSKDRELSGLDDSRSYCLVLRKETVMIV